MPGPDELRRLLDQLGIDQDRLHQVPTDDPGASDRVCPGHGLFEWWSTGADRRSVMLVAVQAIAEKPDGRGGLYVLYLHHDQTAELQHRVPGQFARTLVPKQIMYRVRAAMVELGIAEDGWSPA